MKTSHCIALCWAVTLLASPWAAQAQEAPPMELRWETLPQVTQAVFEAHQGQALREGIGGLERAAEQTPGVFTDLALDLEPAYPVDPLRANPANHTVGASVGWELSRRGAHQRDALRQEARAAQQQRRLEALRYQLEVTEAWAQWSVQRGLLEHLEEDLQLQEETLGKLQAGAQQHQISTLMLRELELEVARLRAEATEARRLDADARLQIESLLLGSATLPQGAPLEGYQPPQEDPWGPLLATVEQHPALEELRAQSQREQAQAKVAASSSPWMVRLGGTLQRDLSGATWGTALVGLEIPLRQEGAPEQAQHQAQARALEWRAQTEQRRLTALLQAEQERWRASWEQHRALEGDLLEPMRQRRELLREGLQRHEVTLEAWIRGRRDLHEATHQYLQVRAALWRHEMRARALRRALQTPKQEPTP